MLHVHVLFYFVFSDLMHSFVLSFYHNNDISFAWKYFKLLTLLNLIHGESSLMKFQAGCF